MIIVVDVAHTAGGALQILQDYYKKATEDTSKEWLFITSNVELTETENVKCMRIPKANKSLIHRVIADTIIIPRVAYKNHADLVVSLQNHTFPFVKCKQHVYLHQAIPFSDYKVKFKDSKRIWFYQNPYKIFLKYNLRKSEKIIVQTEWMRDACSSYIGIGENRFLLKKPNVSFLRRSNVNNEPTVPRFFYPASSYFYKNHAIVEKAIKLLEKEYPSLKIEIVLTLNGNENPLIERLSKRTSDKNIRVTFTGWINQEQMDYYYNSSILLFPSYIESLGLPLLEARHLGRKIIAADCLYSKDVLSGYELCDYFCPNDEKKLCDLINKYANKYSTKRD